MSKVKISLRDLEPKSKDEVDIEDKKVTDKDNTIKEEMTEQVDIDNENIEETEEITHSVENEQVDSDEKLTDNTKKDEYKNNSEDNLSKNINEGIVIKVKKDHKRKIIHHV
ncbi:hypothetical protein [Caldisalinibacter kiritimatiensis]|uniref:Uncharacterized protein n=1 Tax=Caldisalinibacter kiritimatiensis TaxID=1304284 RepID=R1ATE5_9FIRM|nr:hypothetical protein [Caldisalinibacter kiritimatiensis]EOD00393.1 hypothetical protein L21TH_1566 [Caldisalinibacter kiritimatiensis]